MNTRKESTVTYKNESGWWWRNVKTGVLHGPFRSRKEQREFARRIRKESQQQAPNSKAA